MNKIQQLISQGRLKEALEALSFNDESILLTSRLNGLERQERMSTISNSDAGIERSRIVAAILSLAGIDSESVPVQKTEMYTRDSIIKIMSDYRRYRSLPDTKEGKYYSTAEALLKSIEDHQAKKRVEPTYDVSGRMERALNTQYQELMESLKETKLDDKEDFAAAIKMKLGDDIPSWKDIESAYKLCVGRGINNSRVEAAIKAKPSDIQSKIECADIIENWVANYLRG